MEYDDFVEEIEIESYEHLIDELTKTKNFRKNYIFRGIGNVDYELIPKALRRNDLGELTINDYIPSDDFFVELKSQNSDVLDTLFKKFKISYEDYSSKRKDEAIILDKYGKVTNHFSKVLCSVKSQRDLQIKRELYLLLKFLNSTDKIGLEINVDIFVRRLIHNNMNYNPNQWPNKDFFEIISLAQHYGLPTEALDWSYRYEIALYFATNNILHDDRHDALLWAFNYKVFEDNYNPNSNDKYRLQFYRPQYHTNPNLKAQKGLFTFIINEDEIIDKSLDKIVVEDLINNSVKQENNIKVNLNGLNEFTIPHNQKIFYKFIIPSWLKSQILDRLYRDGYSEKFLFPGYSGVVLSMENSVTSQRKLKESPKHSIVMSTDIKSSDIGLFKEICFNKNIGKIFIKDKNSDDIYCYFNNKVESIPEKLKSKILPLLGHANWVSSDIFNNESYALLSIENSMKLDEYLKEPPKKAILMKFTQKEINNILYNNKNVIFNELGFKRDIGKIFICSAETNEIYGYFENHKLIKNIRDNLWSAFEKDSISHKNDFFRYDNGSFTGYAVKLLNLEKFKYPITLPVFKWKFDNYTYVDDTLEIQFLLNF